MTDGLHMSRRIRRTPYTSKVEQAGVRGFSVVNHTLLPKAFQPSVEEDYWHLREHVQLWDVACQRQVQIQGPDAAKLVQWMQHVLPVLLDSRSSSTPARTSTRSGTAC